MKHLILFVIAIMGLFSYLLGVDVPTMRKEDKIRIREAWNISEQLGDNIWKGINDVPFVVLLITDSIEFLVNHPYPSEDFLLSENDVLLKTRILYRKRQFPNGFLATFPAVNGVNCVVVGTPENTNKTSSEWIVTLLHEHFHQYQFTSQGYYDEVEKLGLSGGDETGMWQLNYAFPYDNEKICTQFSLYTASLQNVIENIHQKGYKKAVKNYLKHSAKFKYLLPSQDYRYFSFQIWQEGIARYTEYKFLLALENYIPTSEITNLTDFIPFKVLSNKFFTAELTSLSTSKLNIEKRVSFYAIGFAEGLLLDKQNPKWREKYLSDKFYIEKYFK